MTTVDIDYPFMGRWLVRNSPANRVPSHGTTLFGLSYAIDFVPVDDTGQSAPFTFGSFFRREPPSKFPGFERPILAPVDGIIVASHDSEPDHEAYRGLPSVGYALTQRSRIKHGVLGVAGNHVRIETREGVIALCHLRQGSVTVSPGQRVQRGDMVGRCGNSGNSTEPHLHVHALDGRDWEHANAVPLTFRGGLPRNGEVVEIE